MANPRDYPCKKERIKNKGICSDFVYTLLPVLLVIYILLMISYIILLILEL